MGRADPHMAAPLRAARKSAASGAFPAEPRVGRFAAVAHPEVDWTARAAVPLGWMSRRGVGAHWLRYWIVTSVVELEVKEALCSGLLQGERAHDHG